MLRQARRDRQRCSATTNTPRVTSAAQPPAVQRTTNTPHGTSSAPSPTVQRDANTPRVADSVQTPVAQQTVRTPDARRADANTRADAAPVAQPAIQRATTGALEAAVQRIQPDVLQRSLARVSDGVARSAQPRAAQPAAQTTTATFAAAVQRRASAFAQPIANLSSYTPSDRVEARAAITATRPSASVRQTPLSASIIRRVINGVVAPLVHTTGYPAGRVGAEVVAPRHTRDALPLLQRRAVPDTAGGAPEDTRRPSLVSPVASRMERRPFPLQRSVAPSAPLQRRGDASAVSLRQSVVPHAVAAVSGVARRDEVTAPSLLQRHIGAGVVTPDATVRYSQTRGTVADSSTVGSVQRHTILPSLHRLVTPTLGIGVRGTAATAAFRSASINRLVAPNVAPVVSSRAMLAFPLVQRVIEPIAIADAVAQRVAAPAMPRGTDVQPSRDATPVSMPRPMRLLRTRSATPQPTPRLNEGAASSFVQRVVSAQPQGHDTRSAPAIAPVSAPFVRRPLAPALVQRQVSANASVSAIVPASSASANQSPAVQRLAQMGLVHAASPWSTVSRAGVMLQRMTAMPTPGMLSGVTRWGELPLLQRQSDDARTSILHDDPTRPTSPEQRRRVQTASAGQASVQRVPASTQTPTTAPGVPAPIWNVGQSGVQRATVDAHAPMGAAVTPGAPPSGTVPPNVQRMPVGFPARPGVTAAPMSPTIARMTAPSTQRSPGQYLPMAGDGTSVLLLRMAQPAAQDATMAPHTTASGQLSPRGANAQATPHHQSVVQRAAQSDGSRRIVTPSRSAILPSVPMHPSRVTATNQPGAMVTRSALTGSAQPDLLPLIMRWATREAGMESAPSARGTPAPGRQSDAPVQRTPAPSRPLDTLPTRPTHDGDTTNRRAAST